MFPSSQPTSVPSELPSNQPSTIPTLQPTAYPTSNPTTNPTLQPTLRLASELKESIAGFYNIKDSLNDKSGSGNNGKVHEGVTFGSDRFGSEKSSIQFDGNSGYIEIPAKNAGHPVTNFTISFWIFPNSSQLLPGTYVFDKSAYLKGSCGWSFVYLNSNNFEFSYTIRLSEKRKRRRLSSTSNSSFSVLLNVPDTEWSHITLVKESKTLSAYRDGVLVNSTSIPSTVSLPYSSLPLVIGTSKEVLFQNESSHNSSYFSGGLDDIFIYDRALSFSEIAQLKEFAAPTSLPSAQPSTKPSTQPSSLPTAVPTNRPSSFPSSFPTGSPSGFPSNQPIAVPTGLPSRQPTNFPSSQPTSFPSTCPSSQPSSLPSTGPTNQPTCIPSGRPTTQPSSQPVGSPTQPSARPSRYPTSCPSTQPSRRPSSCPTGFPSTRPSSQPSNQPSHQPVAMPSSAPSSQPLAAPTTIPSTQPSVLPTNQPTSTPSAQPSSQPTKNRMHCTVSDNTFYSPSRDDCVACPRHSFLNHTGDDTCYCSGGYSQVGRGHTLNCTVCSSGEVSLPGSANCTQCLSGFFANSKSNICELCPLSFYSSSSGQSQCTPCPAGRATATLGSTSVDQCISPVPNFTLGFFALFLVVVIFSWYIVFGKFLRVSFERKVKIVIPNMEKCKQVLLSEEEFHYQHLIVVQDKKNQQTRKLKFFTFGVLGLLLMIVSVFFGFVFFIYHVFFTSLILWRGLKADLHLSPILNLLAEGLQDITEYISLPVDLFYFVALPFLYLFEALASINLNLSSVNVTCAGSQAPIELLINCFILGLLVIIIRSDYQLLFNILLNNLNQRFLLNNIEQRLDSTDFRFSSHFFICLAVSALNAINPFQVGLRYCMGFVRIDTFGKNHGIAHEVSVSCNQVPGAPNFDSFLGYMSTIFAWWLILPAIYCLAEVVVPKCKKIDPLKQKMSQEKRSMKSAKIFPADLFVDETVKRPPKPFSSSSNDSSLHDEEAFGSDENESDDSGPEDGGEQNAVRSPEFPSHISSKFPGIDEAVLADIYQEFCKDRLDVETGKKKNVSKTSINNAAVVNRPSIFRRSVHKVTKRLPFVLAFYYYCKQKYFLMISFDLWISNFFSSWITVLKKITLKAGRKEELLLLSQGGKQPRRMTRIISAKESSVKTPGVKHLFSLDSNEFIQRMHLYDLEQMKKQKKLDSLWEKERLQNTHSLPSYYELCLIVRDELHDYILEPFAGIFALLGVGHFFTPTGRYYWKVVLNNYKIFLCVCFGIWTDEAVEAYGLEETSLNLCVDGRAILYKSDETALSEKYEEKKSNKNSSNYNKNKHSDSELLPLSRLSSSRGKLSAQVFGVSFSQRNLVSNDRNGQANHESAQNRTESEKQNIREVLPAVISVLICSRVILFQIVPSLVLFATVSMTLASFPLFIFNDFLIETLPALIIYGEINREMAVEKELQSFVALHPETKEVLSEVDTIKVLSEDYSWRLFLRGIILFWNESRLLQFIQSSLALFFSFMLLIYTRDLLVYLIVILGILFVFIVTKSLVFLLYLGSSLDLKDSDFPICLQPQKKQKNSIAVVATMNPEKGDEFAAGLPPKAVPVENENEQNQYSCQVIINEENKTNQSSNNSEWADQEEMDQQTKIVSTMLNTEPRVAQVVEQPIPAVYRSRFYSEEEKESELPSVDFDDWDLSEVSSSSSLSSHKMKERKGSTKLSSSSKFSTSSGIQASRKHSNKYLMAPEAESAVVIENSAEKKENSECVPPLTNHKGSHDNVSDSETSESDKNNWTEEFGDI
jgi:hypothetical protein